MGLEMKGKEEKKIRREVEIPYGTERWKGKNEGREEEEEKWREEGRREGGRVGGRREGRKERRGKASKNKIN